MLKKLLFIATATVALSGVANAATQGVLGNPSTGSYNIRATIPPLVMISGLQDQTITFTAAEISAAASTNSAVATLGQNFCVYSNESAAGAYGVTITGFKPPAGGPSNPGNETFGLVGSNVLAGSIPMRVNFGDVTGNPYSVANFAVNGTEITGLTTNAGGGPRTDKLDCSDVGGTDASIIVAFPADGVLSAVQGVYAGTLTLTVSPT